MIDTAQLKDSARQTQHDENICELRLYIAGNNKKSQLAFDNLKKICCKYLAEKCHVEVIDLTKNPSLARTDQIIAIPTLVRKSTQRRRSLEIFPTKKGFWSSWIYIFIILWMLLMKRLCRKDFYVGIKSTHHEEQEVKI